MKIKLKEFWLTIWYKVSRFYDRVKWGIEDGVRKLPKKIVLAIANGVVRILFNERKREILRIVFNQISDEFKGFGNMLFRSFGQMGLISIFLDFKKTFPEYEPRLTLYSFSSQIYIRCMIGDKDDMGAIVRFFGKRKILLIKGVAQKEVDSSMWTIKWYFPRIQVEASLTGGACRFEQVGVEEKPIYEMVCDGDEE